MKKPGIGFIGSGFARRVQAPAFKATGIIKLAGVASPNNAGSFAGEFQMPFHTGNWKELIDQQEVTIVSICSPPSLHFEQAMYALDHGKHVLCEKPFCLNEEQARTLWEKARTSGLLHLIDHELRFAPFVRHMKDLLSRMSLGEIFYVTFESHKSFRNDPDFLYNWWSEKSKGGGIWGAIGSHQIDLIRFLVDEITASETILNTAFKKRKDKSNEIHEVSSDDAAASILRFRSGAIGNIISTSCAHENTFDLSICGENGTLKMDIEGNVSLTKRGGTPEKLAIPYTEKDQKILQDYENSTVPRNMFSKAFFFYAAEIAEALNSSLNEIPGAATFEDGFLNQQVLRSGWGQ